VTYLVLEVGCDLLRARVAVEKGSAVFKLASVRIYLTESHICHERNCDLTHPELGVLCGLLRARVTAEKDLTVLRSASLRVYLTDVTFVEYLDKPHIRSSV